MTTSIQKNISNVSQSSSQAFIIPTHLSDVAKEYLRTIEIAGGPIEDIKIFDLAREGYAASTQSASDSAKVQYVDTLEEKEIVGVPCADVKIKDNPNAKNQKVVLYFHGGAFTLGSWKHLMHLFCPVAFHAGCTRAIAADYKLASNINPYPSGLNDCIAVYKKLAKEVGAENIYLLGDSAGGNLVIRVIQECPELKPAAIGLFSPMVSAEKVGDTWDNKPKISYEMSLTPHMPYYAPGMDMSDPRLSPLNGEFHTTAPVKIHTGTLDPLQGQCESFKATFPQANIEVDVKEGIWHGVEELDCPEAQDSTQRMGEFFKYSSHIAKL